MRKTCRSECARRERSTLTVAVFQNEARYALPQLVQSFRAAFPGVRIALEQSTAEHIAKYVLSGRSDIGIATEGLSTISNLVSFPCYSWSHVMVAPEMHPLLTGAQLRLEDLPPIR